MHPQVALSDDEQKAYSVSKDGTILMWDLQTMRKTRLFRPGVHREGRKGVLQNCCSDAFGVVRGIERLTPGCRRHGGAEAIAAGDKSLAVPESGLDPGGEDGSLPFQQAKARPSG
eukprot:1158877-Pelagomonas_calceolata.AAC.2